MKTSAAKPYKGDSPYLFVSYCHKDRRFVLPIIETLARDGYRIWYDEGISPGSEWNEVIADHMSRCSLCVAFISENAVASHNCRREINYALLKKKPLLSVFLEETILTPGLELQLSINQYVHLRKHANKDSSLKAITSMPEFKPCKGTPNLAIEVRSPSFYDETKQTDSKNKVDISDEWFGVVNKTPESTPPKSTPQKSTPSESALPERSSSAFALIRKSTGESIALNNENLCIGRAADSSQKSYVITNNNEISRKHFTISYQDDKYTVLDCASKNGTFLNGRPLTPNEKHELNDGDEIRASTETFVFQRNQETPNTP